MVRPNTPAHLIKKSVSGSHIANISTSPLEKRAVKKAFNEACAKLLSERRQGTIVTDKATNMKKAFATHYTTAKATTGVSCGENLPEVNEVEAQPQNDA